MNAGETITYEFNYRQAQNKANRSSHQDFEGEVSDESFDRHGKHGKQNTRHGAGPGSPGETLKTADLIRYEIAGSSTYNE